MGISYKDHIYTHKRNSMKDNQEQACDSFNMCGIQK